MKRIILISLCLLLCLSAAHSQRLVIKGLSTQSIQIGNKTLTKGKEFNANEKIHWSVKGQSMRLMFQDGEKRGLFINVCREALERIGAENVAQYLCWCNQTWFERFKSNFGLIVNNKPSTRGSVELMEKTASNFPEKRLALVIGNSNYEYLDPLANPLNDVTKVAEKLQSLGFDVLPVYDADDREINSKLNWLKRQSKYDVVIVYYSGHGIQNGNKQYLIPVNGKLDDENDLDYCISLEDVYESLNALGKDKTKMVFVDACRNQGKWQSKIEADSRQEGEDIAVLYSTSTGSKASDGEAGENSPFAQAFLEEIGNPTDNVTTTIGKIKNAVKEKSNQIPIDINFTGQTFTFNPHGSEKTQQEGRSLKTDDDEIWSVINHEVKADFVGFSAKRHAKNSSIVNISSEVTTIRDNGFKNCKSLLSINIPASVINIGKNVFEGCYWLSEITISPDNPKFDSRDSCNAIIEKETNTLIAGCKETIIPNSVTSIGNNAFIGCTELTSITIPNSVTEIGCGAFEGCTGLKSITIPNSVTKIGAFAFSGCSELTSITIPKYVTEIGDSVFESCSSLNSIIIPNSVTMIGKYAFEYCSGLTSVTIPNSVTEIGYGAFKDCSGLTSVTIPNSVTRIGEGAFWGCSGLTSVTIPNSVTSIGDFAFSGCSGLTSVTIPNSVTSIGEEAFWGCSGLNSIIIPNSVTSIGKGAFDGCTDLVYVTIPASVKQIGSGALKGTSWYDMQPDGLIYVGNVAYKYKGEMPEGTTINLKEGTASIADEAFWGCSGLTSVTIPNSVTTIGERAFWGCSDLTSVTIPNSVTSIGEGAFRDCSGLTSVNIPNSVTSIGEGAFEDCTGLTSVTIPNSVTEIGYGAFWGCDNLTSVTIPNSVTSIGEFAFDCCSGLTSVTIPNSVTSIGKCAFRGCTDLKSITIPNSVTSIGLDAFEETPWFNNQPNGLFYAGLVAYKYFGEMPNGTKLKIDEGTTAIGDFAFFDCAGLTSITIPNSVTKIGAFAFDSCTGLTSIFIPYSVTDIGEDAFGSCSGLKALYIDNKTPPEYNWYLSENQGVLPCTLHVPKGCKDAYEKVKPWCYFDNIIDDL